MKNFKGEIKNRNLPENRGEETGRRVRNTCADSVMPEHEQAELTVGGAVGFTLVEMLIVVAIIAILIAIAIPVFSAQLDKTKEATCTYNKTALSRHIIVDQTLGTVYDAAKIESLYKADGYATLSKYYCPLDEKKFGYKVQQDANGNITVFCPYHDGNLTDDGKKYYGEVTGGNVGKVLLAAIDKLFNGADKNKAIHSGAVAGSNNYTGKVIDDYLKANGLETDGEKIGDLTRSWVVLGRDRAVFWSWVDISDKSNMTGKTVPVLKYNEKNGTYTVMTAEVTLKTHPDDENFTYNVLTDSGSGVKEVKKYDGTTINQTETDKKDADKQVELYKTLWEAYEKDPDGWANKINK